MFERARVHTRAQHPRPYYPRQTMTFQSVRLKVFLGRSSFARRVSLSRNTCTVSRRKITEFRQKLAVLAPQISTICPINFFLASSGLVCSVSPVVVPTRGHDALSNISRTPVLSVGYPGFTGQRWETIKPARGWRQGLHAFFPV